MPRTLLEETIEGAKSVGGFVHRRRRYFSVDYGVWLKREHIEVADSIRVKSDVPNFAWTRENFLSMVRDEVGRAFEGTVFNEPPGESAFISDVAMHDYLEKCEEMIFGLRTEAIIRNSGLDAGAKIQKILADPNLGNAANSKNLDASQIGMMCDLNASDGAPLTFILPAFPFKEQNEFRCCIAANTPDFGEIALICRMHVLAMAVNQIYHNDVRWLIVTDGTAYENIFGAPAGCARQYIAHLRAIRDELNLQSTIHFVDLMDLVAKYDEASAREGALPFNEIVKSIGEVLAASSDDQVRESSYRLAEGMKWNRSWSHFDAEDRKRVLWNELRLPFSDGMKTAQGRKILECSVETALHYASFNLAMRWTDLIREFFPWGVRATSHPKKGQVAIPRLGPVSPWNGIGHVTLDKTGRPEVNSKPLYQLN